MTRSAIVLLAGAVSAALTAGCRDERYWGPYQLQVPTALMERSAGRTFEFPLSEDDLGALDALAACELAEQEEPTRELPCICDFHALTVNEQEARIDYRLVHLAGSDTAVLVWVGVEAERGAPSPDELPDLPRIELLAEHHHSLPVQGTVDAAFLEDEMDEVDQIFATDRHSVCEQDTGSLPAPMSLLVGLALESGDLAQVSLELTVRVRDTD